MLVAVLDVGACCVLVVVLFVLLVVCWLILGGAAFVQVTVLVDCWLCDG